MTFLVYNMFNTCIFYEKKPNINPSKLELCLSTDDTHIYLYKVNILNDVIYFSLYKNMLLYYNDKNVHCRRSGSEWAMLLFV